MAEPRDQFPPGEQGRPQPPAAQPGGFPAGPDGGLPDGGPPDGGPPDGGIPAGPPGGPLGDWLAAHVPPLPPPPGTLERIRKRARRRKLARAATAAAGAAVIVTGLATLPRLALSELQPAVAPHGTADGRSLAPAPGQPSGSAPHPAGSGSPAPASSLPPAPGNFAATSVTFVGTRTGWVIGQAGVPGQCTGPDPRICTSLARTDDAGRSWYGVPAPVTGPPAGAHGVGQVRFLNTADGWAFGPGLWATHDGGHTWTQIPTHGMRVTALETQGSTAYAIWAHCGGGGASYAADCTSFALYSSPAGSDNWQPVAGADSGLTAGGAPSSAELLLTGGAAYLLPPNGNLLTAPAGGTGPWHSAAGGLLNLAPCQPGPPGQPGALLTASGLTASGASGLALLCPGSTAWTVYGSADGGQSWQLTGQGALAGTPASLAGTTTGVLLAATSRGISRSTNNGASWQPAQVAAAPPGGFRYVGMTTPQQGVAVPAGAGQHAIWFTYDGGRTWQVSRIP